jgi:protein disulfide-isomerase A6
VSVIPNMIRFVALMTIIMGVIVKADGFYEKGSRVEELTDSNFKSKVLDSDEIWVVEFYAPWCGHC